jgi:hypothetical protein
MFARQPYRRKPSYVVARNRKLIAHTDPAGATDRRFAPPRSLIRALRQSSPLPQAFAKPPTDVSHEDASDFQHFRRRVLKCDQYRFLLFGRPTTLARNNRGRSSLPRSGSATIAARSRTNRSSTVTPPKTMPQPPNGSLRCSSTNEIECKRSAFSSHGSRQRCVAWHARCLVHPNVKECPERDVSRTRGTSAQSVDQLGPCPPLVFSRSAWAPPSWIRCGFASWGFGTRISRTPFTYAAAIFA